MTDPARRLTELVDEVFRLSGTLARVGDELVEPFGLTAARWRTLGALRHGALSVSGIARRRGMRRQSALESVAQLERAGLVERSPDPADARAPLVSLTASGHRALDEIRPRRLRWAEGAARVATEEELAAAASLLRRLREALDAPSGPSAP